MPDKGEIPFFQVDAFSGEVFSGNPAGVCLLERWPSDSVLQSIAAENNLPETAFLTLAATDDMGAQGVDTATVVATR